MNNPLLSPLMVKTHRIHFYNGPSFFCCLTTKYTTTISQYSTRIQHVPFFSPPCSMAKPQVYASIHGLVNELAIFGWTPYFQWFNLVQPIFPWLTLAKTWVFLDDSTTGPLRRGRQHSLHTATLAEVAGALGSLEPSRPRGLVGRMCHHSTFMGIHHHGHHHFHENVKFPWFLCQNIGNSRRKLKIYLDTRNSLVLAVVSISCMYKWK